MKWKTDANSAVHVRTVTVGSRRVVVAPFIGTTWVTRDRAYRRRRAIVTGVLVVVTLAAAALSIVLVLALGRPHTPAASIFATGYAVLSVVGVLIGRWWLARTPARPRWANDGGSVALGPFLFVLIPVLAGFGLAVLPALFRKDFPGERRARELTELLAGGRSHPDQLGAQHPPV